MKLASYVGTRDGFMGVGNMMIRLRLAGIKQALQMEAKPGDVTVTRASHSEIVFEPGDGVDEYMPDGTCEPVDGKLWCFSSEGFARIPEWSPRRAGELGGCRFKRIDVSSSKWRTKRMLNTDPISVVKRAKAVEGTPYDFRLIAKEVIWLIPQSSSGMHCSEVVAHCCSIRESERINPCLMEIFGDYL